MSPNEHITITIPANVAEDLRRSVASGRYASSSDIVREALDEWSLRRGDEVRSLRKLREAVRLGDESGPDIPADEVFAEISDLISRREALSA
jgi:antitoxin ParD1/3/4